MAKTIKAAPTVPSTILRALKPAVNRSKDPVATLVALKACADTEAKARKAAAREKAPLRKTTAAGLARTGRAKKEAAKAQSRRAKSPRVRTLVGVDGSRGTEIRMPKRRRKAEPVAEAEQLEA